MKLPAEILVANLHAFTAFARSRLGDPHLAEDVVQESLIKALGAANPPSDDAGTVTWFYRILRNSIIDLHRRRAAGTTALGKLARQIPETPDASDEKVLCQCIRRLLPGMPESYRVLLERIDLGGEDAAGIAAELGIARSHLNVRLHRARGHLRELLKRNCRACARHGCLDCDCGESSGNAPHGCG